MTVWNTTLVCRFILNELRFLQALKNILKKNPLSPSELSLANWAVCSFLGRPLVVYSTYDYFSDTNRPLCVFVFHFVPSTFFAFAQRNLQRQNLEMKSVQCAKCPKHSVVIKTLLTLMVVKSCLQVCTLAFPLCTMVPCFYLSTPHSLPFANIPVEWCQVA